MQQRTEFTGGYGRRVIRRAWHNACGQLHRTTGPAVEEWTALPGGGGYVLSYQAWYFNGRQHREGRPASRIWHVADDGTRVLECEGWWRHGMRHRVGGPSYRSWHVQPDGTRTLELVGWRVNGNLHRVDGPAYPGHRLNWHGSWMTQEDLPWLRRGRGCLAASVAATTALTLPTAGSEGSPAWTHDQRVAMTRTTNSSSTTPAPYRSAVGGAVLLCV